MNSAPILFVTTGGTIDKQYFDALSEYQIGETTVGMLLRIARVATDYRIVEVARKDSLDLDSQDREQIATVIAAAPETRVVVTHGTDTMTDTARQLAQIPGKTILLTGALAPARFAESDAAFNLGMAVAAAQTCAPGVYIAMSGQVFDGLKVRKDRDAGKFIALG